MEEIDLPKTATGKGEWIDWEKVDYEEFIPGWREIVEMIESGKPTYLDLEFDL